MEFGFPPAPNNGIREYLQHNTPLYTPGWILPGSITVEWIVLQLAGLPEWILQHFQGKLKVLSSTLIVSSSKTAPTSSKIQQPKQFNQTLRTTTTTKCLKILKLVSNINLRLKKKKNISADPSCLWYSKTCFHRVLQPPKTSHHWSIFEATRVKLKSYLAWKLQEIPEQHNVLNHETKKMCAC